MQHLYSMPNYNILFNFLKKRLRIESDGKLCEKIGISKSFLLELRNYKKDMTLNKLFSISFKSGIDKSDLFREL